MSRVGNPKPFTCSGASAQGTSHSSAPTDAFEVSRFLCRKFLCVHWGLRLRRTAPELALSLRCISPSAQVQKRRRPDSGFSQFNTQPTYASVYASRRPSRSAAQNSRPSGSLLLTRKAPSSSTSHRFIPAHSRTCRRRRERMQPFDLSEIGIL